MKCQVCQAKIASGSAFCGNCGAPAQANPYGANPYAAGAPPNPYGTPVTPPPASPYGAPVPPPPAYTAPPVYVAPVVYPRYRRRRAGGCGVLLIILIIAGAIWAGVSYNKHQNSYQSSSSSNSSNIPNASQISSSAEANIFNAQTASGVNTTTGQATNVTASFSTGDTVYIIFQLSGKAGYTTETTYNSSGNVAVKSSSPHQIDSGNDRYYYSLTNLDASDYTTAIYWCTQSDCSDSALAQIVTFSVS